MHQPEQCCLCSKYTGWVEEGDAMITAAHGGLRGVGIAHLHDNCEGS